MHLQKLRTRQVVTMCLVQTCHRQMPQVVHPSWLKFQPNHTTQQTLLCGKHGKPSNILPTSSNFGWFQSFQSPRFPVSHRWEWRFHTWGGRHVSSRGPPILAWFSAVQARTDQGFWRKVPKFVGKIAQNQGVLDGESSEKSSEIGMTLGSRMVTSRILKQMTWLSSLPFHAVFVFAGGKSTDFFACQCQAPLAVVVPDVGFGHVWTHQETPYCTFSINFNL